MAESPSLPPEAEIVEAMKNWALTAPPVTLQLAPPVAIAILSHLQLALRHPSNTGPTAAEAEGVCREIIDRIAPDADNPLRVFFLAGFDPAYDREPDDV